MSQLLPHTWKNALQWPQNFQTTYSERRREQSICYHIHIKSLFICTQVIQGSQITTLAFYQLNVNLPNQSFPDCGLADRTGNVKEISERSAWRLDKLSYGK